MPPENHPGALRLGPSDLRVEDAQGGCLEALEAWQEGGRIVLPPVPNKRRVPAPTGRMQNDTIDDQGV